VAPVAKSTTGKWVSRVGSAGGGKAYKKSRPSNYYGILVVIVVLGIVATLLARYDYQHPATAATGPEPRIGTTWYAGLSVEACGTTINLVPDTQYKGGFVVQANNVLKISPVTAADAGNHATLAQFANEYAGLTISASEIAVPDVSGAATKATTFKNGDACPTSSKYSGQTGQVSYAYWTSFGQKKPVVTTNPASIKFSQYLRVTMAFEPKGVTPQAPSQATVNAMVQAGSTSTTVTPSTLPITSSTVAGSTTSTPSLTSTTVTPTTTIATTTTAPKG
jgi:hypothetical protein